MGIGKNIADFLGAFGEAVDFITPAINGTASSSTPASSGSSKGSDSVGNSTGYSVEGSGGITEHIRNGQSVGHTVKSGKTERHYGGGMSGFIDSLLGSNQVGYTQQQGSIKSHFTNDNHLVATSEIQPDGTEMHYDINHTYLGKTTLEQTLVPVGKDPDCTNDSRGYEGDGGHIDTSPKPSVPQTNHAQYVAEHREFLKTEPSHIRNAYESGFKVARRGWQFAPISPRAIYIDGFLDGMCPEFREGCRETNESYIRDYHMGYLDAYAGYKPRCDRQEYLDGHAVGAAKLNTRQNATDPDKTTPKQTLIPIDEDQDSTVDIEAEDTDDYHEQQNSLEMEEEEMAQIATCGSCKGSGSCSRCNGQGYIFIDVHGQEFKRFFQSGKQNKCPRCGGNCECTGCKGSGHIVAQDIINHYHQVPQVPKESSGGRRW